MAIQFVNNVDFNLNQAESIVIEKLGTDPTSDLVVGRIIFNTSSDVLKQYVSDAGTGSPGWVEVGGGVTDITAASGTYISFTDAVAATGSVDLGTFDLNAVNGTATVGGRYLTKNNTWVEVSTIPGTYTWTIAGDTGSEVVESGDTITFAGGPNCSTAYSSGSNTLTINSDNTTYDLSVPSGTTAIRLDATGPSSFDDVTISGTANEVDITRIGAQELRVGLTDDVTITNDLTVTGELTVSGTGQSSFGGQVTVPATPSADTDAASKQYVLTQVAGVGSFQGGYNANTNAPALTGASNIALTQGDFYVVTTAGTFFTENVEAGDLIFANTNINANSNPSLSDYTVVIADQNIAGEGATDGVTQKGVAGFNSAHFNVTSNGFVSSSLGDRVSLTGGSQAGGLTTFTYNVTNSFTGASAIDVKCEVISAAGETVYASVTRSGANLSVEFTGSISDSAYEVLLTYVG